MSNISILIVDDDLKKIESIIKTIKENYSGILSIGQASNVYEAIESLRKEEFHLLITDLQMPLKLNEAPDDNGGKSLIRSMYKKKNKANIPMYIVGLTQFIQLKASFESVWKVWHYDNSAQDWKNNLRDLITHISMVHSRIITHKIETVYVEGPTDKRVLQRAIELFFPDMLSKIYIDTIQYGGGASWVERQIFIWAKSLNKNVNGIDYLKAVGLFDDDDAGNQAIEKLRKIIDINSAEAKTFSILRSSFKYSPILKAIRSKGVELVTTLEELLSIDCWKAAENNGWLKKRDLQLSSFKITLPDGFRKPMNIEALTSLGFVDNEVMILTNKIDDQNKVQFCNYVCGLDHEEGRSALLSIKFVLQDIFAKLKITPLNDGN